MCSGFRVGETGTGLCFLLWLLTSPQRKGYGAKPVD